MNWHWIDKGLNTGEDGDASEAPSGDIEASGAVARETIPMRQPAKAAFHHPSPRDDDKAFGRRIALDDAMAHAVQIRPRPAALGGEGAVIDRFPQAGPHCLAAVQRRKGVAVPRLRGDRLCTEAGTTATASQCPAASTRATRLRPHTPLPASYPRGPRTLMHLTACVSMMHRRGAARRPTDRRRRRAIPCIKASKTPASSQRRNQP
jgi:hypothetical protein